MTESNNFIEQIYQKYQKLMLTVALNILNDKDYAEDALQISIEKIINNLELIDDLESEKTRRLIITITRNTAIDIYRKRKLNHKQEISWDDVIDMPSVEMTTPYEDESFIALNQLPESYKDIIDLKYSYGYTLNEIADILEITEPNARKRVSRARKHLKTILMKGCMLILCILALALTGVAVNAATGGRFFAAIREFFGAEIVTDENRDLIGTEIILDDVEIYAEDTIEEDTNSSQESCFTNSQIVTSVADGTPIPVSITEFEIENDTIPEIIMTNGASVVFYKNEYTGWECSPGDILSFEFSKYVPDNRNPQRLLFGYVYNGTMHEVTSSKDLSGCYQFEIKEEGEYYIYLFSAASDYQTLKSGKISITHP